MMNELIKKYCNNDNEHFIDFKKKLIKLLKKQKKKKIINLHNT